MDKKLLKHYKSTFTFGTMVSYNQVLHRERGWIRINDYSKIWVSKLCEYRSGVVAGWRWLSNGVVMYDDYAASYTSAKSIFAVEVKRGMMNKVDLVLPESLIFTFQDMRLSPYYIHPEENTPIIPDRLPTMTETGKIYLRHYMGQVPRDAKGRWVK